VSLKGNTNEDVLGEYQSLKHVENDDRPKDAFGNGVWWYNHDKE
jgi:hypothetical protein